MRIEKGCQLLPLRLVEHRDIASTTPAVMGLHNSFQELGKAAGAHQAKLIYLRHRHPLLTHRRRLVIASRIPGGSCRYGQRGQECHSSSRNTSPAAEVVKHGNGRAIESVIARTRTATRRSVASICTIQHSSPRRFSHLNIAHQIAQLRGTDLRLLAQQV
jgi:hypothetical protein